nr:hypothetical protein [Tanacetum cinerariifolium]
MPPHSPLRPHSTAATTSKTTPQPAPHHHLTTPSPSSPSQHHHHPPTDFIAPTAAALLSATQPHRRHHLNRVRLVFLSGTRGAFVCSSAPGEDASKQEGKIAEIDADEDVTLEEVATKVAKDAEVQRRLKESNRSSYHCQLMTEVVTTATTIITAAPSVARRRKGVVIRDPEETATPSVIVHSESKSKDKGKGFLVEEPKPLKKQAHIEQDEEYARELEAELNANINWNEIIPNDEDDVYTEATPLALKVPIVDYQIHNEHNNPFYKIIRADKTHQLFLSFTSLLRNFDREDLEMLWQIVQERFASLKPKNFSDDFLLNTLKTMFEKPNVEAHIWKSQRGDYSLAKVKRWKSLDVRTRKFRSLKKLKFHLASFDMLVKEKTTATAITEGTWRFEHTKTCFRDELIPFVKALKELFNSFDQFLIDELSEVQNVFNQMEHAVEQHRVELNRFQDKMKEVLNENE